MSLEETGTKPPLMLPDDGPRYNDEDASAALLCSAFRPYENSNNLQCPVDGCRQLFLTDDAISHHVDQQHDRGRWLAQGVGALKALELVDRLWVSTNNKGSPDAAHTSENCVCLTQTEAFRPVDVPAQMPLGVDHVCWFCLKDSEGPDVG